MYTQTEAISDFSVCVCVFVWMHTCAYVCMFVHVHSRCALSVVLLCQFNKHILWHAWCMSQHWGWQVSGSNSLSWVHWKSSFLFWSFLIYDDMQTSCWPSLFGWYISPHEASFLQTMDKKSLALSKTTTNFHVNKGQMTHDFAYMAEDGGGLSLVFFARQQSTLSGSVGRCDDDCIHDDDTVIVPFAFFDTATQWHNKTKKCENYIMIVLQPATVQKKKKSPTHPLRDNILKITCPHKVHSPTTVSQSFTGRYNMTKELGGGKET